MSTMHEQLDPKSYLGLMLDTPFSAGFVTAWLFGSLVPNTTRFESLAGLADHHHSKIISHLFKRSVAVTTDEWPVVCANCRTVLGSCQQGGIKQNCANCANTGLRTDSLRAVERLMYLFREAEANYFIPIVMHLADTPLPEVSVRQLNDIANHPMTGTNLHLPALY